MGLHAEISVRVVPKKRRIEEEWKMTGEKKKNAIWALLFSLLSGVSNYRKIPKISLSKYTPPPHQTGNVKNPPLNRPSKYKPSGGLYLENCPQIQSKIKQKR